MGRAAAPKLSCIWYIANAGFGLASPTIGDESPHHMAPPTWDWWCQGYIATPMNTGDFASANKLNTRQFCSRRK